MHIEEIQAQEEVPGKKGWGPSQPKQPQPSDDESPKTEKAGTAASGRIPVKKGWGPSQPQPTTPTDDGNPKVH